MQEEYSAVFMKYLSMTLCLGSKAFLHVTIRQEGKVSLNILWPCWEASSTTDGSVLSARIPDAGTGIRGCLPLVSMLALVAFIPSFPLEDLVGFLFRVL